MKTNYLFIIIKQKNNDRAKIIDLLLLENNHYIYITKIQPLMRHVKHN